MLGRERRTHGNDAQSSIWMMRAFRRFVDAVRPQLPVHEIYSDIYHNEIPKFIRGAEMQTSAYH